MSIDGTTGAKTAKGMSGHSPILVQPTHPKTSAGDGTQTHNAQPDNDDGNAGHPSRTSPIYCQTPVRCGLDFGANDNNYNDVKSETGGDDNAGKNGQKKCADRNEMRDPWSESLCKRANKCEECKDYGNRM
jgi:hypothetical protein